MAKQFSDREKALLTAIYNAKDSNTYVLTNVFMPWLDPAGSIRYDLEKKELIFDYDKFKDADVILNIKKEIISTALLVKYLEDENYIYIIQDDDTTNVSPAFVGAQNISTPLSVPLPPEIAHILNRSLYNIYVSYDLIFFIEHGFKTYEDLQLIRASENLEASKKQISLSRGSLIVSALTLVCSLILSQFSNCSQNKHKETMLNALTKFEANYCAINNQNTLELSAHIDSLGVAFNNYNTQNVTKTNTKSVAVKKQYNLIQIDTINCDGKQYIVLPIKK